MRKEKCKRMQKKGKNKHVYYKVHMNNIYNEPRMHTKRNKTKTKYKWLCSDENLNRA